MNIERIFNKVLIRSGQFLLDTDGIELQEDRFRVIVEDALNTFNRFCPYDSHIYVTAQSQRRITLTPELVQSLTGNPHLGTPDWISDATPARTYGITPIMRYNSPSYNPNLIVKEPRPFIWRKPDIFFSVSAEWDVHCVWKHRIVEKKTTQGGFEWCIPTLDETDSDKFIKLVQGLFLQGIGRSRRAFTMNDLPIVMDGSEIASEGLEMEREAIEDLENVQKFYLAW